MESTETLEIQAENVARELAGNTSIRPKRHAVRYNLITGRARYPFKAMVLGTSFCWKEKTMPWPLETP